MSKEQEKIVEQKPGPVQTAEAKHAEVMTELIKLGSQIEALTDYLMKRETPDTTPQTQQRYTPSPPPAATPAKNINWQTAQGQKGPYEYIPRDADPELEQELRTKGGRGRIKGGFYWLHNSQPWICRK